MKKMLMVAVCGVGLVASAAWEKVGVVQLADTTRISAAVVKLAGYTGNQMLGMILAGAVQNPFADDFGPSRDGEDISIVLFLDTQKVLAAKSAEAAIETCEGAIVYPIASTKDQFIAGHFGGVFTNGLYRVADDDDDDDDDVAKGGEKREFDYYAFSDDGRFVAKSDVPEQARLALAERAKLKPLKGSLARFVLDRKAWGLFKQQVDENAGKLDEMQQAGAKMVKAVDTLEVSLGLYDGGVEFTLQGKVDGKGVLAGVGKTALGGQLFAGVATNAVCGSACATGAEFESVGAAEIWDEIKPVLMKYKIRTDYLRILRRGRNEEISLDLAGMCKYLTDNGEFLDSLDEDSLDDDLERALGKFSKAPQFDRLAEAHTRSLVLSGYAARYTPERHFRRTMRGEDLGHAVNVGFCSLSGLINAAAAAAESGADEGTRKQLAVMKSVLPPEGEGACAVMLTRQGDDMRMVFRMDGEELKAVGGAFMMVAQSLMSGD